jgi:two-component system response regulator AtoC
VFQIILPSLRERKEDIPIIANHFINYFNHQFQKNVAGLTESMSRLLMNYDWPGNIRELRNVIERAVILESLNALTTESLPAEIASLHETESSTGSDKHGGIELGSAPHGSYPIRIPASGLSLYENEKQIIIQALQLAGDNQTKASKLLKITRDTLRYKIKKYRL